MNSLAIPTLVLVTYSPKVACSRIHRFLLRPLEIYSVVVKIQRKSRSNLVRTTTSLVGALVKQMSNLVWGFLLIKEGRGVSCLVVSAVGVVFLKGNKSLVVVVCLRMCRNLARCSLI